MDNGTIERRFVVAPPGVGSLDSPLLLADGSGALQRGYVYAGDVPLLQFDESGNVTYYLEDAIGSVIGLAPSSNPDSTTTTRFFYDSFGQTRGTAGPTAIIPAAVGGDFRFQGVWLETATELYHMRARDYDPRTGQFLSRDPVPGELRAPEALHPYVFALNNPHIYSDRSGQFSMAEITVVGAIQFILNTLRGIAIQEVKATIVSKLVDAMTTVLLGQLKYLGVPLDWASIVKKLEDDPGIGTYYGNVFDRSIWNAFCWGVKQVPGLKRVGEYLHHHVKVNAYGIGVGTPLTPGENCDGVNEGPKGLSAGVQFSSYPDLIVGRPPLWPVGGTPRRTEIDGEVKYSSKVLLESYVHPGYMKHQLRAINAYAAKHTKWRTSVFIVGVEVDRNMIKRYLSRKQQQAAKMVLMGKGAGNRVVNLYVPIRKKPNN